jgi:hypothetical protein
LNLKKNIDSIVQEELEVDDQSEGYHEALLADFSTLAPPVRKRDWKSLNKSLELRMDNVKVASDELVWAGAAMRHETLP